VRLSLTGEHPDQPLVIDIGLTSRRDTVAFAVVLGGDAARTGDVRVGQDAVDAWFVSEAGPAFVNFGPPALSAVVVGHARRSELNGPIRVSMVVPTTGEFVRDTSTGFAFHVPAVGSRKGWFENEDLSTRTDDGRVVAPAADLIENVTWQPAKALHAAVVLSNLRVNDRVDATPPATRVGRSLRSWQGSGPLEVSGVVDRAADIRQALHHQLVVGVAVGAGGLLLVWSLAILLELSLDARRARLAGGER
jgi:hypothetical protein